MGKWEIMELQEQAYLYDLYLVPGWREFFDRMIDEEVKLPREGKFLDLECGSGGYAIDLGLKGGEKVEVVGMDADPELIALAVGKAQIKKASQISFQTGTVAGSQLADESFDLIIADESLSPWRPVAFSFADLARLAKKGGTVVLKLLTRGSFDEVFSIYWEALHDLDLVDYSPGLERLINARMTVTEAEHLAINAGLRHVHSVIRRESLDYPTADAFFEAPLIKMVFLDSWMSILPDDETRRRVRQKMGEIIDRERQDQDFDCSIKATLIVGKK